MSFCGLESIWRLSQRPLYTLLYGLVSAKVVSHRALYNWETFFITSSPILGAFYNYDKNCFVFWYWTGYFSIMSKLNHLYNAVKNTLLSNTSEMGDNVLKACPSVQWSLGIIKCQNYKKKQFTKDNNKISFTIGPLQIFISFWRAVLWHLWNKY